MRSERHLLCYQALLLKIHSVLHGSRVLSVTRRSKRFVGLFRKTYGIYDIRVWLICCIFRQHSGISCIHTYDCLIVCCGSREGAMGDWCVVNTAQYSSPVRTTHAGGHTVNRGYFERFLHSTLNIFFINCSTDINPTPYLGLNMGPSSLTLNKKLAPLKFLIF